MSEVSDSARDRLQGLHDCLFGWWTSCRLQLFEICQPPAHLQQKVCFVFARDRFRKALVKCRCVFRSAGKDSLCNTRKVSHLDDTSAPSKYGSIRSSMLNRSHARDRSAGCPKTFLTTSTTNSRLAPAAHVLSLTANQFCHDFAGGTPRESVRAAILGRLRRVVSCSRFTFNIRFRRSTGASPDQVTVSSAGRLSRRCSCVSRPR